ncbi:MAG: hypothetical protein IJW32_03445 [Clostridia bacterium]|nr:hypothetical protein [Clostridia bacterium]
MAVDEALSKVEMELETLAISKETKVLKVIHGYGSRGVGGKIKKELNILLKRYLKQGKILDYIQNEMFTTQNAKYQHFTKLYPELILDSDLQNQNPGITLIFLQ